MPRTVILFSLSIIVIRKGNLGMAQAKVRLTTLYITACKNITVFPISFLNMNKAFLYIFAVNYHANHHSPAPPHPLHLHIHLSITTAYLVSQEDVKGRKMPQRNINTEKRAVKRSEPGMVAMALLRPTWPHLQWVYVSVVPPWQPAPAPPPPGTLADGKCLAEVGAARRPGGGEESTSASITWRPSATDHKSPVFTVFDL